MNTHCRSPNLSKVSGNWCEGTKLSGSFLEEDVSKFQDSNVQNVVLTPGAEVLEIHWESTHPWSLWGYWFRRPDGADCLAQHWPVCVSSHSEGPCINILLIAALILSVSSLSLQPEFRCFSVYCPKPCAWHTHMQTDSETGHIFYWKLLYMHLQVLLIGVKVKWTKHWNQPHSLHQLKSHSVIRTHRDTSYPIPLG